MTETDTLSLIYTYRVKVLRPPVTAVMKTLFLSLALDARCSHISCVNSTLSSAESFIVMRCPNGTVLYQNTSDFGEGVLYFRETFPEL